MRITYDREADALYIQLVDGEHECRTVHLSEDVSLDFGEGEVLVGIEVLEASTTLGRGQLAPLTVENMEVVPAK
jgi:uncharacterized protein YuzE